MLHQIYLNNWMQGFLFENNKNICKSLFQIDVVQIMSPFFEKNRCLSRVVNPLLISILVYLPCLLQIRTWKYFQGCHSFMQVKPSFHCRHLFTLDLVLCSVNHFSAQKQYNHDITAKTPKMYCFEIFCLAYMTSI